MNTSYAAPPLKGAIASGRAEYDILFQRNIAQRVMFR